MNLKTYETLPHVRSMSDVCFLLAWRRSAGGSDEATPAVRARAAARDDAREVGRRRDGARAHGAEHAQSTTNRRGDAPTPTNATLLRHGKNT